MTREKLTCWKAIVAYFSVVELVISLFPYNYGIFRDEFLYISMSDHLSFGYLEVPPLPAFVLFLVRSVFGSSIFSLHLIPALLGVVVLIITSLIVKRLGGNKFALVLTMTCMIMAPIYIGHNTVYTYDCFDLLFWTLCTYFIVMIISTDSKKYWIYFGISAGLGMLSKITMLYLGFGVVLTFLITKDRKKIFNRQFVFAGIAALLIMSPYIIWQICNGFPLIEYLTNYTSKVDKMNPITFILMQIITLNPIASVTWIIGLFYFLFKKTGKKFRALGIIYLIIAALFIIQQTKYYLLTAYYPVLIAGGSIQISNLIKRKGLHWLKPTYICLIILAGLILLPMARPVLPPEVFSKTLKSLGVSSSSGNAENNETGALPQQFADMFGWEELSQKVSTVYNSLPENEKRETCILAANYGEAGSMHFYKDKYNIPDPVCGHNIFYFWGPGNNSGRVMIVVGYPEDYKSQLEKYYDSVTVVGKGLNKYSMPYENESPMYLCKGCKVDLKQAWNSSIIKHFG